MGRLSYDCSVCKSLMGCTSVTLNDRQYCVFKSLESKSGLIVYKNYRNKENEGNCDFLAQTDPDYKSVIEKYKAIS